MSFVHFGSSQTLTQNGILKFPTLSRPGLDCFPRRVVVLVDTPPTHFHTRSTTVSSCCTMFGLASLPDVLLRSVLEFIPEECYSKAFGKASRALNVAYWDLQRDDGFGKIVAGIILCGREQIPWFWNVGDHIEIDDYDENNANQFSP